MMKSTLQFVSLSLVIGLAWTTNPDEVTSLPGVNFSLSFKHYAGYLEALGGNQFFYWFFESQRNPAKDPVLLWLNGGPGCSSLLGALKENGPLSVSGNSVQLNPFSWNINASVIYLESPAEVGFSYNPSHNGSTDDDLTAENNFAALKSFFKKFPHLQENEFYITGESYGGIYVPTLSLLALQNKFPVNFRGFAIGNGYVDVRLNDNSKKHYFYEHGFIDENTWEQLISNCCANVTNIRYCDFESNAQKFSQCKTVFDYVDGDIMFVQSLSLMNPYNIYETKHPVISQALWSENLAKLKKPNGDKKTGVEKDTYVPLDTELSAYLNQPDVKKALHIRSESPAKWQECNFILTVLYYKRKYLTMKKQVQHLLESGLKGLIYNGDFDSVCNFFGDMWFSEELGFKAKNSLRQLNMEGDTLGDGIPFLMKQFEHFYYVIVRGAGHMVPSDKPAQAQYMIYKFLIDA